MSLANDWGAGVARRYIAAEALSDVARGPDYNELWARPARGPSAPAPQARRARSPAVGIAAVALAATALIGLRAPIVRLAPPLAGAYRAVGLPVNLAGLELRDVRSKIVMEGARKVLVTEGEIVNIRREQNRVPSISLAIRGANGLDRYSWTAPAPKSRLEAGEKIAFRARLAAPPEDGADVLVRFAKAEEPKPAPRRLKGAAAK